MFRTGEVRYSPGKSNLTASITYNGLFCCKLSSLFAFSLKTWWWGSVLVFVSIYKECLLRWVRTEKCGLFTSCTCNPNVRVQPFDWGPGKSVKWYNVPKHLMKSFGIGKNTTHFWIHLHGSELWRKGKRLLWICSKCYWNQKFVQTFFWKTGKHTYVPKGRSSVISQLESFDDKIASWKSTANPAKLLHMLLRKCTLHHSIIRNCNSQSPYCSAKNEVAWPTLLLPFDFRKKITYRSLHFILCQGHKF